MSLVLCFLACSSHFDHTLRTPCHVDYSLLSSCGAPYMQLWCEFASHLGNLWCSKIHHSIFKTPKVFSMRSDEWAGEAEGGRAPNKRSRGAGGERTSWGGDMASADRQRSRVAGGKGNHSCLSCSCACRDEWGGERETWCWFGDFFEGLSFYIADCIPGVNKGVVQWHKLVGGFTSCGKYIR
jgi:hypothetical protein